MNPLKRILSDKYSFNKKRYRYADSLDVVEFITQCPYCNADFILNAGYFNKSGEIFTCNDCKRKFKIRD